MKILNEKLMMNDLEDTLNLTQATNEIIIQRAGKPPIVMLTLEKYNEIKTQVYQIKQED